MVFVTHFSTPSQTELIGKMTGNGKSKIPEYAKNYKREWFYIVGINRKCGQFDIKLNEETDYCEEVFLSSRARELVRDFKNVLEAQKKGRLQDISKLKFKLSVVENIIELRRNIYFHMGNTFYPYHFFDKNFQDFFEKFIIFTNNVNIKDEDDFEDDTFVRYDSINILRESESESERESESESESDDYIDQVNILLNNL